MTKRIGDKEISLRQEEFCEYCVDIGNRTEAYAKAYHISNRKSATRGACRQLKHLYIKKRIEELKEIKKKAMMMSKEKDEEVIEEVIDPIHKNKGLDDIEYFVDYFLDAFSHIIEKEKKKNPSYFSELWGALDKHENLNLIIARGHAKTTGILIWILHAICYEKVKNILYIAKNQLGQDGLHRIRNELEENMKIQKYFGNLVPKNNENLKEKGKKKWQSGLLEFTNRCRLQTLPFGRSPRGQRPDIIIVDDPQDNNDVQNIEVVDRFNLRMLSSLFNTLLPGGSMVVVGTIIGNLCLVKYLRDEKKWKTIQKEACDKNFDNILWPEMWSKESLKERCYGKIDVEEDGNEIYRGGIGTASFNQEFRNIPISHEDALIREERINYITEDQLPKTFDKIVMGVDPAVTIKQKSDYTGIVVVGFEGDNRYVLDAKQIKITPMQNEDYIYHLYEKRRPSYIIKEDNVELGITEHLKDKGVNIIGIRTTKDKFSRLLKIAPIIESGHVYCIKEKCKELVYQLTNFPDKGHDDLMDAFVFTLMDSELGCNFYFEII